MSKCTRTHTHRVFDSFERRVVDVFEPVDEVERVVGGVALAVRRHAEDRQTAVDLRQLLQVALRDKKNPKMSINGLLMS